VSESNSRRTASRQRGRKDVAEPALRAQRFQRDRDRIIHSALPAPRIQDQVSSITKATCSVPVSPTASKSRRSAVHSAPPALNEDWSRPSHSRTTRTRPPPCRQEANACMKEHGGFEHNRNRCAW